jgi:hypothetical protein
MIFSEVVMQAIYPHAKAKGIIYFANSPNLKIIKFIAEPRIIYGKIT